MTPFEPRPITSEEVDVIRAMLDKCLIHPVSPAAIDAVPSLTVVGGCPCGCASVDFVKPWPTEPRPKLLADGVATMPAGARVGLIVWGYPNAITAFEIYELDPYGNRGLPDPASIQSFFATE